MDRAARAKAVLQDEVLHEAFNETLALLNRQLLNATTPEEREAKWHEYHALNRAWNLLKKWPTRPSNPKETV